MKYNQFDLEREFSKNEKQIIKDAFIFGTGAIFVGVGVFGAIYFGQELLEFYNSGEHFTLVTEFPANCMEDYVGFCLIPVAYGGIASFKAGKGLLKELPYRKNLKNKMK